jgi:hypothetical protein
MARNQPRVSVARFAARMQGCLACPWDSKPLVARCWFSDGIIGPVRAIVPPSKLTHADTVLRFPIAAHAAQDPGACRSVCCLAYNVRGTAGQRHAHNDRSWSGTLPVRRHAQSTARSCCLYDLSQHTPAGPAGVRAAVTFACRAHAFRLREAMIALPNTPGLGYDVDLENDAQPSHAAAFLSDQ